jgi:hypothetical protein
LSPRDGLSKGIHHVKLSVPNHRDDLLPAILHGELSLVILHDEQP